MAILSGLTISGGGITIVGGIIPAANDPYFMYNTLLLPGNGTNGAQNNTFTDSSTNNLSVTRNGTTIQGTFSPYGGNWSNYFDGTGDYLTTPSTLAMALGSTFTVECWIYVLSWNTSSPTILDVRDSNIVGAIYLQNNGTARMQTTATGTIASQTGIVLNTWIHVAFVSDATSSRVYVNGSNTGATNQGQALFPTTAKIGFIGADFSGGFGFNGYISNLRAVKGTALYTANFTPSTTPLTPITNTSLLTCADNRLIDDSINNFTLTRNGNVSVQKFSPFNPSSVTPTSYSGYFDGTGDYLTPTDSSEYAFGTGDFTVECWIHLPSVPGGEVGFVSTFNTGGGQGFILGTGSGGNAGKLHIGLGNGTGSGNFDLYDSVNLVANTWTHVAVVRISGTVTLYKNGVSVGSGSGTNNIERTLLGISISYPNSPQGYVTGYISNVRIVKGTGVYTGTFTPSTTPLTAIANTSLLTCQSPTFIDNSTNNFAITAFGNSQPTQQNPFGFTSATTNGYTSNTIGGSGYFDGAGDYLVPATSSALALATNAADFTIECWVYNNGYAGSQYGRGICIYYPSAGYGSNRLMFRLSSGADRINVYLLANSSAEFGGSGAEGAATITPNAWTHVALVRNAGVFYVYVNGVIDITVNSSSAASSIPFSTFNTIEVGRTQDGTSPDWFGNISNYRFVKGTAVYTSNFVPPAQPVTAVTNTALLLNMTNSGIIDNAIMNNLDTVGNAQISTTQSKFGGSSMYFDGTGDWLVSPISTSLGMGSGDFTIELWVYATNPTYAQGFFHINATAIAGTSAGYAIGVTSAGVIQYYAGNTFTNTSSTITANTWTYLAMVRSAGTVKVYVNGILPTSGGSIADSQNVTSALAYLALFYSTPGASYAMTGYINDFRVTKGYARYTANFTPPTTAFSVY